MVLEEAAAVEGLCVGKAGLAMNKRGVEGLEETTMLSTVGIVG